MDSKGTPRDWEESISRIRGVLSARVSTDGDKVTGVHVLARAGRVSKHLARDVVSVLLARHGVEVDARLISVVQIDDGANIQPSPARVRLLAMNYRASGSWGRADIEIEFSGEKYSGIAEGAAISVNRLRLFAQATLNAVLECVHRQDSAFVIEDVVTVQLGQRPAVVVAVGVSGPDGELVLTGSCLIRGDEWEAVARATLDAINRRFALLVDD